MRWRGSRAEEAGPPVLTGSEASRALGGLYPRQNARRSARRAAGKFPGVPGSAAATAGRTPERARDEAEPARQYRVRIHPPDPDEDVHLDAAHCVERAVSGRDFGVDMLGDFFATCGTGRAGVCTRREILVSRITPTILAPRMRLVEWGVGKVAEQRRRW